MVRGHGGKEGERDTEKEGRGEERQNEGEETKPSLRKPESSWL